MVWYRKTFGVPRGGGSVDDGGDNIGDNGYPLCGGYNKYRLRGLACRRRLQCGRMGYVELLKGFYHINRVVNVRGPCRCQGGIRTTFTLSERDGVVSKICRSSSRGVIPIAIYVARSRGTSRVVNAVHQLLGGFGLHPCGRSANEKFLHRILMGHNFGDNRVVIILIAKAESFPGGGSFITALLGVRPRVAAMIRGMGGRGADVILNGEDRILFNSKCVARRLNSFSFEVSPGTFCRVGPVRARILCGAALRFTKLANGRAIVSTCYNAKAVNVFTSPGTGGIINIRLGPSTMGSTHMGTGLGSTRGARFCGTSTNRFLTSTTSSGRGCSIIVVSPPHDKDAMGFLGSIMGLTPGAIICISYGPRALTESLVFLIEGNCGIGGVRPISVFPRAGRIRAMYLLSGLRDGRRVRVRIGVSRLSLASTRDGTACRRVQRCIFKRAKLGIDRLCVTRIGRGCNVVRHRGCGGPGSRGTGRPRYPPRGRGTVARTLGRFNVVL